MSSIHTASILSSKRNNNRNTNPNTNRNTNRKNNRNNINNTPRKKGRTYRKINYNTNTSGLIIGSTVIQSISGPVSMTILRPSPKVYERGLASQFPLIILFGDAHMSFSNECTPCTPPNCYSIYDPSFLKLLDTLAEENHPVDFYTETSLAGISNSGFKSPLEKLVAGDMVFCYQKWLRNTPHYQARCPTTKIRWQATDVRAWDFQYSQSFIQSLANNTKSTLNNTKHHFQQIRSKTLKVFPLESLLTLHDIFLALERTSNEPDFSIEKVRVELKNVLISFFSVTAWGSLDNFFDVFQMLAKGCKPFAEKLFSMMNSTNSLIYKQIQKQTYSRFKSIDFWKDVYRYLFYNVVTEFKFNPLQLPTLVDSVINFSFEKKDITPIADLMLILTQILLDVYFLTRMFKQPDKGKRASLVLGYFGDSHTTNIVKFLLYSGFYDVVQQTFRTNSMISNEQNRCQKISVKFNLSDAVKQHNAEIDRK